MEGMDRSGSPLNVHLPPEVNGVMSVDLHKIHHNYQTLKKAMNFGTEVSAVVKADAYGLGMRPVSKKLFHAGCTTFFVATIDEGILLRQELPRATIYVFSGLLAGCEALFDQHTLIPVLNDLGQIKRWSRYAKSQDRLMPAALHFDTGIVRLGLSKKETLDLIQQKDLLRGLDLKLILSHLACSDLPNHPFNDVQWERFRKICRFFPKTPKSFANSHGAFLNPTFQSDMVRPGKALYGLQMEGGSIREEFRPVMSVYARVFQVREVQKGETVGYDATFTASRPMRLAVLSIGYADGWLRALSNNASVSFQGFSAPMVGLISMDLATVDVTHIPERLCFPGGWAEIVGPNINIDQLAKGAGTTSRELLCHLGQRYLRIYEGD